MGKPMPTRVHSGGQHVYPSSITTIEQLYSYIASSPGSLCGRRIQHMYTDSQSVLSAEFYFCTINLEQYVHQFISLQFCLLTLYASS